MLAAVASWSSEDKVGQPIQRNPNVRSSIIGVFQIKKKQKKKIGEVSGWEFPNFSSTPPN